jgi:hypothetical protein
MVAAKYPRQDFARHLVIGRTAITGGKSVRDPNPCSVRAVSLKPSQADRQLPQTVAVGRPDRQCPRPTKRVRGLRAKSRICLND